MTDTFASAEKTQALMDDIRYKLVPLLGLKEADAMAERIAAAHKEPLERVTRIAKNMKKKGAE